MIFYTPDRYRKCYFKIGEFMYKKVSPILFFILLLAGCVSSGGEEVADTPLSQVFVFPGEQEKRLISQEVIDLPNCTGNAESSQEVTRSHTVLYTLELGNEITVSADGRAGIPGVGEVGVGGAIATEYRVGYGREETVSRAQTVRAAAGSHMQHTIQQFEIWENGEVLIVAGETNKRLPYSFRRDFSIEAVAPANIGCSQNSPTQIPLDTAVPIVTPTVNPPQVSQSNCEPNQSLGLVELWDYTNHQWSIGIWGPLSLSEYTVGVATIDSADPAFTDFQIWISPCNTETHGYVNGAQFWPIDGPGLPIPNAPITLGELTNIDYITVNSGRWALGNPR